MKEKFQKVLKPFENRLVDKYFSGTDYPGMLDYMIWPWFERLGVVDFFHPDLGSLLPTETFPKLVRYKYKMIK